MRTEQQSEASRANGASGQGPATVLGKVNSSQNAATTGVYSSKNFLSSVGDDIETVAAITTSYLDTVKPKNIIELHYTHRLINFHIRNERLARLDRGMHDIAAIVAVKQIGNNMYKELINDLTGPEGKDRLLAHAFERMLKQDDAPGKFLRAERQINKGYDDALKSIQNLRKTPFVQDEPEPESTTVESTTSVPETRQAAVLPRIADPEAAVPSSSKMAQERATVTQADAEMTIK